MTQNSAHYFLTVFGTVVKAFTSCFILIAKRKMNEPRSVTVYTWNEQAEIQYVIDHEDIEELSTRPRKRRRIHVPRKNERRARHIPGPLYMPAIFLVW